MLDKSKENTSMRAKMKEAFLTAALLFLQRKSPRPLFQFSRAHPLLSQKATGSALTARSRERARGEGARRTGQVGGLRRLRPASSAGRRRCAPAPAPVPASACSAHFGGCRRQRGAAAFASTTSLLRGGGGVRRSINAPAGILGPYIACLSMVWLCKEPTPSGESDEKYSNNNTSWDGGVIWVCVYRRERARVRGNQRLEVSGPQVRRREPLGEADEHVAQSST